MKQDRLLIRLRTSTIVLLRPSPRVMLPLFGRLSDGALLAALRGACDDAVVFAQLREYCATIVPGGVSAATVDDIVKRVALAVAQGRIYAYRVSDLAAEGLTEAIGYLRPVSAKPADDRAVPFLDSDGKPVLDATGNPMQRPASLSPEFFVDQGLADQQIEQSMIQYGGGDGVLGYEFGELFKFKQGGPWDAQRVGGRFHREFVSYATVIIGLYAAACGMTKTEILVIQNGYAALFSRYPAGTLMDNTYTHLPAINVTNTMLGYTLYETQRVRPTAQALPGP